MLLYAYNGKRLQEKNEDATDAALQKMRRRYGVPYMQPAFFDLPAGILLQQYYIGDQLSTGYDCFDLQRPAAFSFKTESSALLLLFPKDNAITLQYGHNKIRCNPHQYLPFIITNLSKARLLLPTGTSTFFYTAIPNEVTNISPSLSGRAFPARNKIIKAVEELLYCTLDGEALKLLITARTNDLLRLCLFVRQQNSNIGVRRLQYITGYIRDHLDEPLSDNVLSGLYGGSTSFFRKVFKAYTGYYPHRYVINARMQEAKSLLLSTGLTVKEIAWAVGYADDAGLTHIFEEHFGQPPKQFRDNALKQNNQKRGSK